MKLVIPGSLPGMNEILAASNNNRHVYNEMKRVNTLFVARLVQSQKIPLLPKSDYIITWICENTRRDKDNIMTGQKFIFDGLVQAERIKNDGWKQIGDVTHRFLVDRDNPRIEIEIKELSA